jgi:non-specific serine/threonine protein kinase
MTIAAGTMLGRYRVRAQLGAGGMGEVYLADDPKLLRQIALKVLSAEFCQDASLTARFLREAQAASALNHPGICTIYEIDDDHSPPFIVMEYVEGETLAERISAGGFEIAETVRLALQLASALAEAHAHNIVHRDIKPANIVLTDRGDAKILDFGIAKRLAADGEMETQMELSQPGFIVGTAAYMSPEQARGLPVDQRTDVWSLGVVLYEMLTRQSPFASGTNSDVLAAVLRSEPASLRQLNSAVPGELERIVLKMLRKDRSERYAGAQDLLADLEELNRQMEFSAFTEEFSLLNRPDEARTRFLAAPGRFEDPYLAPHKLSTRRTRMIGRAREIDEVKTLLRSAGVKLLTLTGIGGTGKTTIAEAVASDMLAEFSHGVFFVELAAVTQPELVVSSIAQTLGIKESGSKSVLAVLKEYLRDRHVLLVLDNFEQVLAAAERIAELLMAGPLKILVTSREVLQLSAERIFVVAPLALPSGDRRESLADLQEFESVKLFVERARSARPGFILTEENSEIVVEICRRLDGLPLAIELAAARMKILSADSIRAKLENSLKLLKGGPRDLPARQQTVRGAIEWSYDLLTDEEKRLFRQLSVFAGGFRLEDAEAICDGGLTDNTEVLDLIESLVNKSLLISKSQADQELRFRMLTIIREYAGEVLEMSGEAEDMRERHAICFLALAEADLYLDPEKATPWINRLREERYNLRAALRWSLANDPEIAARLAAALRHSWILQGYLTEGREWLEAALKRANEIPASLRRQILIAFASMAQLQGDRERARNLYEEGMADARAAGDLRQLARATRGLAATAYLQGDFKAARAYVEEALRISRELNDKSAIAASLNRLGDVARTEENYAAAEMHFQESVAILRKLGNRTALSNSVNNLAAVTFANGQYAKARELFGEALTLAQEFGDKIVISHALDGFAALAGEYGILRNAAQLAGAAEEIHRAIGFKREPAEEYFRQNYLTRLRQKLDEPALAVALEEGRRLAMADAVAIALSFVIPETADGLKRNSARMGEAIPS